jgi:hypothetical protein
MIDGFFLIDIIVHFLTTYITKQGEEIFDYKMIGWHYVVGGRFIIDFLATFPFSGVVGGKSLYLELFGILKMVRIT